MVQKPPACLISANNRQSSRFPGLNSASPANNTFATCGGKKTWENSIRNSKPKFRATALHSCACRPDNPPESFIFFCSSRRESAQSIVAFATLERLKKNCSHLERGFLSFWRDFGEGAGLNNPVTELKRSQNSKRSLLHFYFPNGYSFFENALRSRFSRRELVLNIAGR